MKIKRSWFKIKKVPISNEMYFRVSVSVLTSDFKYKGLSIKIEGKNYSLSDLRKIKKELTNDIRTS